MTSISHEWITLSPEGGASMDAYVSRPADSSQDRHAGIFVFQEIWGVNAHIREVADRFARLGYTALAPDLFHRSAPRFEAPYTDMSGRAHAEQLTPDGVRADLEACRAWMEELLLQSTDVASMASCGFCMGGRVSFVANAVLPLRAAIAFYGGGIAERHLELAAAQHGPLLLFWAGKDTHITKADRRAVHDALETAGKRFTEVTVGHAQHGFFCDQRAAFDSEAAHEAWGLVTAFLQTQLD